MVSNILFPLAGNTTSACVSIAYFGEEKKHEMDTVGLHDYYMFCHDTELGILIERLRTWVGISKSILDWYSSDLSESK